ncbi:MAG: DNA recombination protein RmuC [Rhodomicrobium sp.]
MDFAYSEWMRLKDDPLALLAVFAGVAALAFLLLIILTIRQGALRAREERTRGDQARAAEAELTELKGRLAQMTEITALRQEELARTLNGGLDRVGQNLGASVAQLTEIAALRQEELARTLNDRLDRTGQHVGTSVAQMAEIVARRHEELSRTVNERLDRAGQHLGSSVAQMTEVIALRQEELARTLNERLDRVGQHLGSSMEETGRRTSDNLSALYERLAVIDSAQRSITELSGRVVSLQDVLSNKQARGAFGQIRMEAIIEDGLPKGAYSFQATLSNGRRPDCLIHLPYAPAGIVVDAKFPLEAFEALREAGTDAARREAQARVSRDVAAHIEDIAEKYFIPGETQDTAMMFVPSESVYAELHENFAGLIQKAHRARIVIVSPNMLMLAVQTMMAILKDVRMREQADVIQREVGLMLEDVGRLRTRVLDFQRHFTQLGPDLEKIMVSADKIASRGARIEGVELEERKEAGEGLITAAE